MELPNAALAILFYQAEPLTVRRLSGLLKHPENDIREALVVLRERLSATGLRLIENADAVTLGTAPEASELIEAITKEELSKELSKSALETLAIVLYKGPITRSEIDYIRGVNSTFILRNLLIRDLVEKIENPKDQRSFLYKPTFALFEYMGITKADDLPQFEETMNALASFVNAKQEEDAISPQKEFDAEIDKVSIAASTDELSDDDETETPEDNLEADILEEDEMGSNYDDEALQEHHAHDIP